MVVVHIHRTEFQKCEVAFHMPTRFCRKNTGPFEVALIASAIARHKWRANESPRRAADDVDRSLQTGERRFPFVLLSRVRIKRRIAGTPGAIMVPVIREEMKRNTHLIELVEMSARRAACELTRAQDRLQDRTLIIDDQACEHVRRSCCSSLYQPTTSVSRLDDSKTDMTQSSAARSFSSPCDWRLQAA